MTGQEIKGRLDRIGKTPLEHFQDIKEIVVEDGLEIKVKDMLPYFCENVETALIKAEKEHKALEDIESGKVELI